MAPKKKGNKKGQDDWEAELGESIAPANNDADGADGAAADTPADDDEAPAAGGLMGLMRKNKEKRKKKGLSEDYEEPAAAEPAEDLTVKAPVEATMDDEFALPEKKGKGGKQGGKQGGNNKQEAAAKGGDDEVDASGRVLTKAEKEKLKKEREKQRKKEQVSLNMHSAWQLTPVEGLRSSQYSFFAYRLRRRRRRPHPPRPNQRNKLRRRKRPRPSPRLRPPPSILPRAARSSPNTSSCSRSSKRS